MIAILKITEPNGHTWEFPLVAGSTYAVGRAKENDVVLNDRRVSRRHALLTPFGSGFKIIDGHIEDGNLIRSVNRVYVNGLPQFEKFVQHGDIVTIGETDLKPSQLLLPELIMMTPLLAIHNCRCRPTRSLAGRRTFLSNRRLQHRRR
jgi:adenylate cyclase